MLFEYSQKYKEGYSRCKVCGRYFYWKGMKEPEICGNSQCSDFWHEYLVLQQLKKQDGIFALYASLKRQGKIG